MILILYICIPTCLLRSQPAHSGDEESGTLVMAARTDSLAIIAVDSKISDNSDGKIDGTQKLLDFGGRSSCALEGWLSNSEYNVDVASSLRNWISGHPDGDPNRDVLELLKAAAEPWNERIPHLKPGEPLPKYRKPGERITMLVCGEVSNGQPIIVRGETFVEDNNKAGFRRLDVQDAGILYVEGPFNISDGWDTRFFATLAYHNGVAASYYGMSPDDRRLLITKEVWDDPAAKAALRLWLCLWLPGGSSDIPTRLQDLYSDPNSPAPWKEAAVMDLFKAVFRAVESHVNMWPSST